VFFAVGIPLFYLIILGFKLLITNMKSLGKIVNYTLFALWIISIGLLITIAMNQMMEYSTQGRVVTKQTLTMNPQDTLQIKFVHNDFYANDVNDQTDFRITQNSADERVLYSNNVELVLAKTDEAMPYLQIEKKAKGRDLAIAKEKSGKIDYGFKFENNQLVLDNYFVSAYNQKFRDQEIELILYLPKGTLFKVDNSVQDYDDSDTNFFILHDSSDAYIYQVGNTRVKCLNCPLSENEFGDLKNDAGTTSDTIREVILKVNGKEIITSETVNSKKTSLTIDGNGIIIKTK
jgi:hypothetical protein